MFYLFSNHFHFDGVAGALSSNEYGNEFNGVLITSLKLGVATDGVFVDADGEFSVDGSIFISSSVSSGAFNFRIDCIS